MSNKKDQHFVPKFYLRNFSYEGNNKQIGVYNKKKDFFYSTAPLAGQAYKKYLYGQDGKLENWISQIEGNMAFFFQNIQKSRKIPLEGTKEYFNMVYYIVLSHIRNPFFINKTLEGISKFFNGLSEKGASNIVEKLLINKDFVIQNGFQNLDYTSYILSDLKCKLLINNTKTPFITSNTPVVKYNQFLEKYWEGHSKIGFGCMGLQIYYPIDTKIGLFFYDFDTYKVGNNHSYIIDIYKDYIIDEINILSFNFCDQNIFFNHLIDRDYVDFLIQNSINYKEHSVLQAVEYDILNKTIGDSERSTIVTVYPTDFEIDFDVPFVKILNNAQNNIDKSKTVQLRKAVEYKLKMLQDKNNNKNKLTYIDPKSARNW